jgi:hypothetical protein
MNKISTLVSLSLKQTSNKLKDTMLLEICTPSDSTVQTILNYSKTLSVKKSKTIGFIEFMSS